MLTAGCRVCKARCAWDEMLSGSVQVTQTAQSVQFV
jgi:hypothetical protein